MKRTIAGVVCLTIVAFGAAMARASTNDDWVGIWNAHVDGQPTGTLTLAADTGELGGTVVLGMVCCEGKDHPHVIAREPHVLMSPRTNGNTLSFQVRMKRPDGMMEVSSFTVTLTSPGKANIHCVDCGPDAPVVALTKSK